MLIIRRFDNRSTLAILLLGGLVGWILAFLYEGPVLYAMASAFKINGILLNAGNLLFLAIGLLTGVVLRFTSYERLRLVFGAALVTCSIFSVLIFFLPGIFWYIAFPIISFAAGLCMCLWGHLLKAFIPKSERLFAVPIVMLLACAVLTAAHILATQISPYAGYGIAELSLASALFCFWRLPYPQRKPDLNQLDSPRYILRHFGALICFILCVTINAGFMFQSMYPLFAQHETLLSFYINIPYMAAILILTIFRSSNKIQTLYMGLALWGFALLMTSNLDLSVTSFFLITTTMLFASGMLDFFWWTTFASSVDAVKNPATPVGIILAANILGSLTGGQISNKLGDNNLLPGDMAQLGLLFVLVNVVLLSIVREKLIPILPDADFLKQSSPSLEEDRLSVAREKLSPREMDVFLLLLDGATDKIIANTLHISPNTIKSHNRKIFFKLGMTSRIELRKHFLQPNGKSINTPLN